MKVRDIMTSPAVTVNSSTPVAKVEVRHQTSDPS